MITNSIIRFQQQKILRIFTINRFPIEKPEIKYKLMEKLSGIILNGDHADDEDIALFSLLKATQLIPSIFPKPYTKIAKKFITDLTYNEQIGREIEKFIESIEALIATTAVIAVM
jgi:hypothetical protein